MKKIINEKLLLFLLMLIVLGVFLFMLMEKLAFFTIVLNVFVAITSIVVFVVFLNNIYKADFFVKKVISKISKKTNINNLELVGIVSFLTSHNKIVLQNNYDILFKRRFDDFNNTDISSYNNYQSISITNELQMRIIQNNFSSKVA